MQDLERSARARAVELLEEFGARDALERGSRGRTRAVRVGPRRALAREGDPDAQLDEVTAVFRPRRPQGFVVSRLRLCCGGRRIGRVPIVRGGSIERGGGGVLRARVYGVDAHLHWSMPPRGLE